MIDRKKIEDIIQQEIGESEVFIVDIQIKPGNLIQVYLDEPSGISIDTCVAFSRAIESSLDRDVEDFELQVSSPGLNQPFKVPQQYTRQLGKSLQVVTSDGEKFKGKLISADEEKIVLDAETKIKVAGSKKKKTEIVRKDFLYSEIKTAKVDLVF